MQPHGEIFKQGQPIINLEKDIAENKRNRINFISLSLLTLGFGTAAFFLNSPATPIEVIITSVGSLAATSLVWAAGASIFHAIEKHDEKKLKKLRLAQQAEQAIREHPKEKRPKPALKTEQHHKPSRHFFNSSQSKEQNTFDRPETTNKPQFKK